MEALSETPLNQPKLHENTWWYFTRSYSVGFSESQIINQFTADVLDLQKNSRLSWHLTENVGGWRAGNLTHLNNSNTVLKYAFIKK